MTLADTRSKQIQNLGNQKLPLPEGEEVLLEVKEADKMILVDRLITITLVQITVVKVEVSMVEINQGIVVVMVSHLAIEAKIIATLVETKEIEVEAEEDLIPAQMSEGLD